MFSCEIGEIFENTCFEEHLRTTAYIPNKPLHVHKTLICRRERHTNVLCMFQLKVAPTQQLNGSYLPNFKTKRLKASWFDTIKYNKLHLNKLISNCIPSSYVKLFINVVCFKNTVRRNTKAV